MTKNNDDRRVRKTKKALQNAFAELLLTKEIQNIFIRELTDYADIHRATFYMHYKDIYDLYEQLEDTIIYDLSKIIKNDPSHSYDSMIKALIDYIYDHSKIAHIFLIPNAKHSFYEKMNYFLEEKYFEIWKYETGKKSVSNEWSYFARYHIQGFIAILALWAKSDFSYPKEKIFDILLTIDTNFDKIMY